MTIAQLQAQLFWLLDQLAAVHEAYSSSGKEGVLYKDPDNFPISQGDYLWRLGNRIESTRVALKCREEIAGISTTTPATPHV